MEYSNVMNNIYDNIDKYTPNKKRGMLLLCEDMISDMLSNKKFQPVVTELFMKTKRQKTKHFSCFYYAILFRWAKKYQTKFYPLLYYKNCKQTRALSNRN